MSVVRLPNLWDLPLSFSSVTPQAIEDFENQVSLIQQPDNKGFNQDGLKPDVNDKLERWALIDADVLPIEFKEARGKVKALAIKALSRPSDQVTRIGGWETITLSNLYLVNHPEFGNMAFLRIRGRPDAYARQLVNVEKPVESVELAVKAYQRNFNKLSVAKAHANPEDDLKP